ncbi:unnamed protein product [Dibothriocephalus latus]|uniref:FAR1 domain-containing protein n=1 Tax=Dibothriocephalus latus TaxID=60516 RepID=A0A3P7PFW1_DIBLA|nr:unnamed protein product [Dibothriocephalus latus]
MISVFSRSGLEVIKLPRSSNMTFTDQTEIFSEILASKLFPSYELFRQALELFTKITGSKFAKDKTSLYRPGSLNRDSLVYRSAEFKCSSKCEACFILGCKKRRLFVKRYHMVHNHSVADYQATPQPVVEIPEVCDDQHVDLTVHFNAHFPSLTFASYDDLMEALASFQKATGSVYVKKSVHKWPIGHANSRDLVYSTICFQCVHYGNFFSSARKPRNHSVVPFRRKEPTCVPAKNCGLPCASAANEDASLNHSARPLSEYFGEIVDVDHSKSQEASPVPTSGVVGMSYSPPPLSKADYYEGSQRLTSVEPLLQCIRGILVRSDSHIFEKRTSDLRLLVRSWETAPAVDSRRRQCRPSR